MKNLKKATTKTRNWTDDETLNDLPRLIKFKQSINHCHTDDYLNLVNHLGLLKLIKPSCHTRVFKI